LLSGYLHCSFSFVICHLSFDICHGGGEQKNAANVECKMTN
jgi:hypothetical protein